MTKSNKKVKQKSVKPDHIIEGRDTIRDLTKHYYMHGGKFFRLKDSSGELEFFTYSSELNDLFKNELRSQNTIILENSHIFSHLTYYQLISFLNKLRLDPIKIKAQISLWTSSFDFISLLTNAELYSIIGMSRITQIFNYFSSEGISFTTAKINRYILEVDDFGQKQFMPEIINQEDINSAYPVNQLINIYERLNDYEKAAFNLQYQYIDSTLLPVLFIKNYITIDEYLEIAKKVNKELENNNCPSEYYYSDLENFKLELAKISVFLDVCKKDELQSIIDRGETKHV